MQIERDELEYAKSPEAQRQRLLEGADPSVNPDVQDALSETLRPPGSAATTGPRPSDIAASAKWGGTVTATEAGELDELQSTGSKKAVIEYGKRKGWSEGRINLFLRQMFGENVTVDDPGGWWNFINNKKIDFKTGENRYELFGLRPGVWWDNLTK